MKSDLQHANVYNGRNHEIVDENHLIIKSLNLIKLFRFEFDSFKKVNIFCKNLTMYTVDISGKRRDQGFGKA